MTLPCERNHCDTGIVSGFLQNGGKLSGTILRFPVTASIWLVLVIGNVLSLMSDSNTWQLFGWNHQEKANNADEHMCTYLCLRMHMLPQMQTSSDCRHWEPRSCWTVYVGFPYVDKISLPVFGKVSSVSWCLCKTDLKFLITLYRRRCILVLRLITGCK